IGLRMADDGARDWRIGWRLTSNVANDLGLQISLDATRRESANDNGVQGKIEHEAMLRGIIRW
ncbi:MAG: hypothetical protein OXC42_00190, partial [Gammaproteobacteria bacterium]|nr:hypothetical protein [Gammaproteobacteria bacterium]